MVSPRDLETTLSDGRESRRLAQSVYSMSCHSCNLRNTRSVKSPFLWWRNSFTGDFFVDSSEAGIHCQKEEDYNKHAVGIRCLEYLSVANTGLCNRLSGRCVLISTSQAQSKYQKRRFGLNKGEFPHGGYNLDEGHEELGIMLDNWKMNKIGSDKRRKVYQKMLSIH